MNNISNTLIEWYEDNKRDLPWRHEPSPYQVWISEIILQQTRVSQGLSYYLRFMEKWPTVEALAQASEEEVLKLWQGLGYYSRARNLHQCAKQVVERHGSSFPADYDQLKGLKGIGSYTAAAIASIAFNLPHAVVDGNVYRVLSRLYDIDTPINNSEGMEAFASAANELLNRQRPGLHNQAMMEFGALLCTPQNPDCLHCPVQAHCLAFDHQTVMQRPVKLPKVKISTRHFNYLVLRVEKNGEKCLYLHKRDGNDIWKNLYDFPNIESSQEWTVDEVIASPEFAHIVSATPFTIVNVSAPITHKLTHRTIIARFIEIKLSQELHSIQTINLFLTPERDLDRYPVPRLIDSYLNH